MKASIALMGILLPRLLAEEDCRNGGDDDDDNICHHQEHTKIVQCQEEHTGGGCQDATSSDGEIAAPQKYPSSSVTMEAMTSVGPQKVLEDESLTSLPSQLDFYQTSSSRNEDDSSDIGNLLPPSLPLHLAHNIVIPFRPMPISISPALPEMSGVFLEDPGEPFLFHENNDDEENEYQCCHDPIGDGYAIPKLPQTNASKHNESRTESLLENKKRQKIKSEAEETIDDDDDNSPPTAVGEEKNTTIADPSSNTTVTEEPSSDTIAEEDEPEEDKADMTRVDYASKSAGAQVIEKSPGWSGTSDLLNSDNDRYAIVPTNPEDGKTKFLIIALSEEILVKQVVLTNYERYSSFVKDFQILGSQTMANWVDLGQYTASPPTGSSTRETFDISSGTPAGDVPTDTSSGGAQYWARYLKFRFLSHYGDEHYLTITQILVHGTTMQQGFQEHWEEEEKVDAAEQEERATEENSDSDGSEQGFHLSETETGVTDKVNSLQETADTKRSGAGNVSERQSQFDDSGLSESALIETKQNDSLLEESRVEVNEEGYIVDSSSFSDSWRRIVKHGVECPFSVFDSLALSRDSKAISSSVDRWVIRAHVLDPSQERHPSDAATFLWAEEVMARSYPTRVGRLGNPSDQDSKPSRALLEKLLSRISIRDHRSALTPSWNERTNTKEEVEDGSLLSSNQVNTNDTELRETEGAKTEGVAVSVDSNTGQSDPELISIEASTFRSIVSGDSQAMDLLLARVPSAHCLSELDAEYQTSKATQTRSSGSGSTNSGTAGGGMEPIFKKLTDEIKLLQTSLTAQEKFSKELMTCFQKVLLDLLLLQASERVEHLERLQVLEQRMLRGDWVHTMLLEFASSVQSSLRTTYKYLSELILVQLSSFEKVMMIVFFHINAQPWFEPIRLWLAKPRKFASIQSSWLVGFPISLFCMVLLRRYRLKRSARQN
eukprot:CAMPEP_0168763708 /NCGR_PEP_ID=MMETSP0724-20121128/24502_1 /TAXON_ID=265536 /ORGANISM="Amphiprora sp., Strain CCMP467" /LENGTH=944 /DNA_ID=CAMNT_0008812919 /DNA_START=10 /DNA_END=2844 /DNA_ORIENTATION=+